MGKQGIGCIIVYREIEACHVHWVVEVALSLYILLSKWRAWQLRYEASRSGVHGSCDTKQGAVACMAVAIRSKEKWRAWQLRYEARRSGIREEIRASETDSEAER